MSYTPSPASSGRPSAYEVWTHVAPYVVPPVAASVAIVPAARDLVAKSARQLGKPVVSMTMMSGCRTGLQLAPTVGGIVGTQMALQHAVEKKLTGDRNRGSLSKALVSSAVVGTLSAPALAVFNAQAAGQSVQHALRNLSARQCGAIAVQETAFVGGLSVADRVADVMKRYLGDNSAVSYLAAATAGALGSVAGHPANTALTRWQNGMPIERPSQLMAGAATKARALALFSVLYKAAKNMLSPAPRSVNDRG